MHLEVDNLWKSFGSGDRTVDVLAGVGLRIDSGEAMAVTGPSGSGKSTLLHIIGTLEPPSRGTVRFSDVDPFALPEPALAAFPQRHDRLRLSGPSPAAAVHRARERANSNNGARCNRKRPRKIR